MIWLLLAILVVLLAILALGCAMCALLIEISQAVRAQSETARIEQAAAVFAEHLTGRAS